MNDAFRELMGTEEGRIAFCEEHAIAHVGELIATLLKESGMTRTQLAKKMNVSQGRITQILDGDANLTLGTIARVVGVFDRLFEGTTRPMDEFCVSPTWRVHNHQPWEYAPYGEQKPDCIVARFGGAVSPTTHGLRISEAG